MTRTHIDGNPNAPFAVICTGGVNITAYRDTHEVAIRCANDAWGSGEYVEVVVTENGEEIAKYNAATCGA